MVAARQAKANGPENAWPGVPVADERWSNGLLAIPSLLIRGGVVCRASERGPEVVRREDGSSVELFDVIDGLARAHSRLYLIDLSALEGRQAQLDYIQEISRDVGLWIDAGTRSADHAIDILVAGAQKVVLSSARLQGPTELAHAWELSSDLLFEIEIEDHTMSRIDPGWHAKDPAGLARDVRQLAEIPLVLGFRNMPPSWPLVRSVANVGPTWVAGNVTARDAPEVETAGAVGAIYPLGDELLRWDQVASAKESSR